MEKKFLLVGALLLAGGFSTMNADVIYVTESGSGDGTSWSSAASLEDALSWAAAGDEVFVAMGPFPGSLKCGAAAKVNGIVSARKPNRLRIRQPKGSKLF